jgi:hypothetical protein
VKVLYVPEGQIDVLTAVATRGSVGHTRSVGAGREVEGRVRARFRDGDREAVRVVYRAYGSLAALVRAREHGTFLGSGKVTRIRDGKISEHDAVRDDLGVAKQLKWLPPTPVYPGRMLLPPRRERQRRRRRA